MIEADPESTGARWRVLLLLAVSLAVAGCNTPARLTASATPCGTSEVKIQSSEFSRNGSTTAWCAECKGKLYQCVTNPDRTRVQCHVARADDICK